MNFFDSLKQKTSETAAKAMVKAQRASESSRLNLQITEEQKQLDDVYYQIGKLYVSMHGSDGEPAFAELIERLRNGEQNLAAYRKKLEEMRDVRICPSCGAEVPKGSAFCSNCGTPMPAENDMVPAGMIKCPNCGAIVSEDVNFCIACGKPIPHAQREEPAEASRPVQTEEPVEASVPVPREEPAEASRPVQTEEPVEASAPVPREEPAEAPAPAWQEEPEDNRTENADSRETFAAAEENSVSSFKDAILKSAEKNRRQEYLEEKEPEKPEEETPETKRTAGMTEESAQDSENGSVPPEAPDGIAPADKKVCPSCGAVMDADALFCTECGASLRSAETENFVHSPARAADKKICPNCGAVMNEDAVFCTECGSRL